MFIKSLGYAALGLLVTTAGVAAAVGCVGAAGCTVLKDYLVKKGKEVCDEIHEEMKHGK